MYMKKLEELLINIENQSDKNFKVIRSENVSEFMRQQMFLLNRTGMSTVNEKSTL